MYDLHSHILPQTDDGAKSSEVTFQMAQISIKDGITSVVATPHSFDVAEKSSVRHVRTLVAQLNIEFANRKLILELLPGMENHLELDLPELLVQDKALTINDSRYVLVELPFTSYPAYANEVLSQIQALGYVPIIAHPERNAGIQNNPELMFNLVDKGMMGQITAGSVIGSFGPEAKKSAITLLSRRMVHIIASDAHSASSHRIPILSNGVAAAAAHVGEEVANSMVETIPKAVLENRDIVLERPKETPPDKRHWWSFNRRVT